MTTTDRWMSEYQTLAQLRDEVRLKAHLLKAELRDQLHDLERRWDVFERDTRPVRDAVGASTKEIGASTRTVLDSLAHGYRRIRESFKEGHA